MMPVTFAADVEVAARHVQAGALLLRLLANSLSEGSLGKETSVLQSMRFIANGLLDQYEILHELVEDAGTSSEGAP